MNHPRTRRRSALGALAVAAAVAALAASASSGATASHVMSPASGAATLRDSIGQPLAGADGAVHFGCQSTSPAGCYGPDQIRVAYGVQPLLDKGLDGTGSTIAIVDAYGSPTIQSDLAQFESLWGLSAADFQVVEPFGVDPTSPANASGWAGETSLDVEWAHAIAPGAKIELVVAKSNDDGDILDATQWILDHNAADVLSQSYGEAEQCMDPAQLTRQHELFKAMSRKGITLFASSGDQGAGIPTCDGSAYFKATSTPASDPYVTSVGGTQLNADGTSGAYNSETTWNESTTFGDAVAGGGGVSTVYTRPSYQAPVWKNGMRAVPDVSYNAGVFTGVIAVLDGSYYRFGGTSAGSPQWAALAAIADQIAGGRIGALDKALYQVGKNGKASSYFHDVADGSTNGIPDLTPYLGAAYGTPIEGWDAVPGYDLATGLGTPIASTLLPYLAANASHGNDENGWGSVASTAGGSNGRHGSKNPH